MASSDDEGETLPDSVSDYYFKDNDDEFVSFSKLPVRWNESESSSDDVGSIFLGGNVDNGLRKLYQQVKAWKFDISTSIPEISVLSKDDHWIKLKKPRKIYEKLIRSILITVRCLWFCKSKPEASGKFLWDYLSSKVFSLYDPRPSENDLLDHIDFIGESIKRDETLAKSKFLAEFLENPSKRNSLDEDVTKPGFIVDDINGEMQDDDVTYEDSDSDGEDEYSDLVCAICDNGGKITCCEGKCFRSFHTTPDTEEAQDASCESLCSKEAERVDKYLCENCQYNLHQCFVCAELGSSDKATNTEVFRCSSATCGHFYHPKCVAKLLQKNDKIEQQKLLEKIAAGEPFICPAHKCAVCKQTENEKVKDLQFAVCRRCPKSYHRKCLPRDIMFEHQVNDDDDDDEDEVRAWDGLLSKSRALIYCLEHEIDPEIGTPARTIIFRNILTRNTEQPFKKKLAGNSVDPSRSKSALKSSQKSVERSVIKPESSSKKRAAVLSGPEPVKKKKVAYATKNPLRTSLSTKVKKPSQNDGQRAGQPTLGSRLFDYYTGTESNNLKKDETSVDDNNQTDAVKPLQTESLPPLDDESKQRIMALMKEAASSVTLDEVKKYHLGKEPSTHAYTSRVDKSIILARVEGSVEALNLALKKLEEGCSVEDAMTVCEPSIIDQLLKWKDKLKVYLAPFLYGMRYTSFGRHFTKVEKLEKIVDKLHWYVEDGDTIVDFCCGANDFSCLMKKRLDETGKKKCSYKNFDIKRPKNDFNFEKRNWMDVLPKELPSGSRLIMGLNPPFGINAALANLFIANALKFKPKLLILIVPPGTERLDSSRRSPPYDLIWEDVELLDGKAFYLPGSLDVNDKQMDQWNLIAPPLYLWSRPNWTDKHKSIAQKHGHIPKVQQSSQSDENKTKSCVTAEKVVKEDSHPVVNRDLKTTYEAIKPKNKKRKQESPDGLATKSKQIVKEKGNQSSSKKARLNKEVKNKEHKDEDKKMEEARAPVDAQKHENTRASVQAQKHENIRAPVEAQKRETTPPVEVKKSEIKRAPVETQKHKPQASAEAQKHEVTIDVQKHTETLVSPREIGDQKPKVEAQKPKIEEQKTKFEAQKTKFEAQKHEKSRDPSREIEDQKPKFEAQKHENSRISSRVIEDQKTRATPHDYKAQKHEKSRAQSREMDILKPEKTRVPSREFEIPKYENKRPSPRTPKYENKRPSPPKYENTDFSFVDTDHRHNAVVDESTFSLKNDIGHSYDEYPARKYSSAIEEPYMGSSTSHNRRLDNTNHVPPGFSAKLEHLQYPLSYERAVARGPYYEETGARGSGGYSMARHEPGYSTPYNRTSMSATQRYAPRLDEMNHRGNYLARSEVDEMSHMRMGLLGRSEPVMGSRGVGGYGPPVNGQGVRMDAMGFPPGMYHPYSRNSSGGWLNE